MIRLKSPDEIERMRKAGKIVAEVLHAIGKAAKPRVATAELDALAEELILRRGGKPLFKGYRGYPRTICASVNEEVVHGIPGPRRLRKGDIVSVDVGVSLDGYAGDAAVTFPVGEISTDAKKLISVCREALRRAISEVRPGVRLSRISSAVQEYVEAQGCSVVRQFTGHGIGKEMHEEPQVPNFVSPGMDDPVLEPGLTLAIEPMVNSGGHEVDVLDNHWTVVTKDRSLSAHFEHTVAVTEDDAEILTK